MTRSGRRRCRRSLRAIGMRSPAGPVRERRRWLDRVPRKRKRAHDQVEAELPPAELADEVVIVVPYVVLRCPRCRADKPKNQGVHDLIEGRTRYHLCRDCGYKFLSRQIEAWELPGWERMDAE